jgi:hypothetical protein
MTGLEPMGRWLIVIGIIVSVLASVVLALMQRR